METGFAMYNDFGQDYDYSMILSKSHRAYMGIVDGDADLTIRINYSGPSECVWCGELDFQNGDCGESDIACLACRNEFVCTSCHDTYPHTRAVYIDGQPYCSYCVDSLPHCELCDEPFDDVHSRHDTASFVPLYSYHFEAGTAKIGVINHESDLWGSIREADIRHICRHCAEKLPLAKSQKIFAGATSWRYVPAIPIEQTPGIAKTEMIMPVPLVKKGSDENPFRISHFSLFYVDNEA